jgi:hypothetical protein
VLGEVKHLGAVGEHRGTPLAEIQPPRIQFRERRYKLGDRFPLRRDEPGYFGNQFGIGKVLWNMKSFVHVPVYHSDFIL